MKLHNFILLCLAASLSIITQTIENKTDDLISQSFKLHDAIFKIVSKEPIGCHPAIPIPDDIKNKHAMTRQHLEKNLELLIRLVNQLKQHNNLSKQQSLAITDLDGKIVYLKKYILPSEQCGLDIPDYQGERYVV